MTQCEALVRRRKSAGSAQCRNDAQSWRLLQGESRRVAVCTTHLLMARDRLMLPESAEERSDPDGS